MQLPAVLLLASPRDPGLSSRAFKAGVAACTAAVAAFVLIELSTWPPHEDETLALFVGRGSLSHLFHTVLDQRGGAPLHFVLAWIVAHSGGGLIELRLISALLAVASIPIVAVLTSKLAGRTVALGASALVSGSWVLLFHGIYGRMYSLFLFTSALSYLALLHALERGRPRAWILWALAMLATLATHPYGALVLVSQVVFVLWRRERVRQALIAFAAVCLVAIPLWRSDLVLAPFPPLALEALEARSEARRHLPFVVVHRGQKPVDAFLALEDRTHPPADERDDDLSRVRDDRADDRLAAARVVLDLLVEDLRERGKGILEVVGEDAAPSGQRNAHERVDIGPVDALLALRADALTDLGHERVQIDRFWLPHVAEE